MKQKFIHQLILTLFYLFSLVIPISSIDPTFNQMLQATYEIQQHVADTKSVLLDVVSNEGYNFWSGCLNVVTEYTYGTERSIEDLTHDYRLRLQDMGWIWNPNFEGKQADKHLFMWDQAQADLRLYQFDDPKFSHWSQLDFHNSHYRTIYSIRVLIHDKLATECTI